MGKKIPLLSLGCMCGFLDNQIYEEREPIQCSCSGLEFKKNECVQLFHGLET